MSLWFHRLASLAIALALLVDPGWAYLSIPPVAVHPCFAHQAIPARELLVGHSEEIRRQAINLQHSIGLRLRQLFSVGSSAEDPHKGSPVVMLRPITEDTLYEWAKSGNWFQR